MLSDSIRRLAKQLLFSAALSVLCQILENETSPYLSMLKSRYVEAEMQADTQEETSGVPIRDHHSQKIPKFDAFDALTV